MRFGEIWRYPVKSMAGERLESCRLEAGGVPGDRLVHVEDAEENVITARTRPKLLGLHAVVGPDGEPLVDGLSWRDPRVAARVEEAAGPGARLLAFGGLERFDVLPLLLATDGAIARFGRDGLRLRPNLVRTDPNVRTAFSGVCLDQRPWYGTNTNKYCGSLPARPPLYTVEQHPGSIPARPPVWCAAQNWLAPGPLPKP
jgi:hypothetical protein